MSETNIYVIGDYNDDLAFNEVHMRLDAAMNDKPYRIFQQNVPAFDTVSTGFALAQLALNAPKSSTEKTKFFVNTAPRKDDPKERVKCEGEALVYFKLYNGIEGVAVNSGYSLSFVKEAATEIKALKIDKAGSQFRSRDLFPYAFGKVVKKDEAVFGEDIKASIPDIPEDCVVWTDGYGNLKCSINPSKLTAQMNKHVKLYINQVPILGKIAEGIFGVEDGEFCISQGSSGWPLPDGSERRFTEIVLRGSSAAKTVGYPYSGKKISWQVVE